MNRLGHCLNILYIFGGVISFFCMLCPANIKVLVMAVILAVLLSITMVVLQRKGFLSLHTFWGEKKRFFIILDITLAVILSHGFFLTWQPSSKIEIISSLLHLSKTQFLYICSIFSGAFCACGVNVILVFFAFLINTLVPKTLQEKSSIVVFVTVVVFEYLSLIYSSIAMVQAAFYYPMVFIINLAAVVLVNMIIGIVIPVIRVQLIISASIFTVWSIANYYVIYFHGSPLYYSELKSAKTALNVINGYQLTPGLTVIVLLILFFLELYMILKYIPGEKFRMNWSKIPGNLLAATACILILFIGMFSSSPIIPKYFGFLSWNNAIYNYGFMACSLRDIQVQLEPIQIPENYNPDILSIPESLPTDNVQSPDIILILNESFCDLNYYTDIKTDTDYLKDFYSLEGAVYGHAIAPRIGGGTNDTEFELLTSNSVYLLPAMDPFTYLNDDSLSKGLVPYLKSMGYSTTAMHCYSAANYSRETAYTAMGFDKVILGPEGFTFNRFGNRAWLDEDNYNDLLNELSEEQPQFVYLLSFQNHGGYEQNDEKEDTVHVLSDLSDITDDMSEYMSSLKKSAEAFRMLTEKLSKREKPTIVCMVGDHAPSLIQRLSMRSDVDISSEAIAGRVVPYVIWSNYKTENADNPKYASMVDIMPVVLRTAGIPLSPYYSFILDLNEQIPVRTSEGLYADKEGATGLYDKKSPYFELINTYFCLEYNVLFDRENYREDLYLYHS